ncbi:Pentatricopeptide repeat-containing protein [Artemisia annua]|uniref:Pentatricopeptide repeat-containing protein n=1 Tax=Artemisia annua TaxID=35608 RepID=A0A2U1PEC0_ARTAN|nr:Pentatricopeptide repeat-containing protein [Artemisia annua]
MRWSGMSPSDRVLSLIIHCCASFYVRRLGKVLYCEFLSFAKSVYNETPRKDVVANNAMISALIYHGMREKNSVTWNSMITCYSKIGNVKSAQFVFDHNPIKDVASWNAMIHGYSKAGQLSLAEALFNRIGDMKNLNDRDGGNNVFFSKFFCIHGSMEECGQMLEVNDRKWGLHARNPVAVQLKWTM